MAQFDFGVIDPNTKTGTQLAADLNQWRTALHSTHAGAARPAYAAPGMLWVDQASGTDWKLKVATPVGDAIIGALNPTTNQIMLPPLANGTAGNPAITWANSPGSGFWLDAGVFKSNYGGVKIWEWTSTQFAISVPLATYGQTHIFAGGGGGLSTMLNSSLVINAPSGTPSIAFVFNGVAIWSMYAGSDTSFYVGESSGAGPAALGGFTMVVAKTGAVYGRSFNPATFAATNVQPMTDALAGVLQLRGVRCLNTETQQNDIRLELAEVEQAFPELVREAAGGLKSINYMALAAPIIEAIRELDAQIKTLKGTPA